MQKSYENTLASFPGATFCWFIDSPLASLAQLYMAVGRPGSATKETTAGVGPHGTNIPSR